MPNLPFRTLVRSVALSCTTLAFVAPATAQGSGADQNAGFGAIYARRSLDALSGLNTHLGCTSIGGKVYVTARRATAQSSHRLVEIDLYAPSTPARLINQDPAHAASVFGQRDLATDGVSILGGSEFGITVTDPVTGLRINSVVARNGVQSISNPITGAFTALLPVARALAFDPQGNSGNGSMLIGDFGLDLVEIDLAGNVLQTYPNTSGYSVYGLARDPRTGDFWFHTSSSIQGYVVDRAGSLFPTGDALPHPEGFMGGVDLFLPTTATLPDSPFDFDTGLVLLRQGSAGGPDEITMRVLHRDSQVLGQDEVRFESSISGAPWDTVFEKSFRTGDVLGMRLIDPRGVYAGFPCYTILNVGVAALADGVTNLNPALPGRGILAEFRALNILSAPLTDPGMIVVSHSVNGPLGNGGFDLSVPVTIDFPVGTAIRTQSIHVDPMEQSFFNATGELFLRYDTGLVVEAVGVNSFNADQTSGFFRVFYGGADRGLITSVVLDGGPIGNGFVFDTAQAGMADRFDGGDSSVAGCLGTYRNGTALSTGLDFTQSVPSACVLGARTGFQAPAIDPQGRTPLLRFDFTGFARGEAFEFDADTDFGMGETGDAMAGMQVTVTFAGGSTVSRTLAIDPARQRRGFAIF